MSKEKKDATVVRAIRIKQELDEVVKELADSQNTSVTNYIKNLILKDIKVAQSKNDQNNHGVELDIALAIATILTIAGQQEETTQLKISEDAFPIAKKITEIFLGYNPRSAI